MRILMVTGSYPPDLCGVGAYTKKLVEELEREGLQIQVEHQGPWKGVKGARHAKELSLLEADVIHVQYPTIGFGRGLSAQLLSLLGKKVVVTIHEVSQVHWLRRLSLIFFSVNSSHLLFTNEYDCYYARKIWPWIRGKSSVIPLSSSILPTSLASSENSSNKVLYFGLIRPKKGLEEIIEAARISKERGLSIDFRIVGSPDLNSLAYFDELKRKSAALPIEWVTGLDDNSVAEEIMRSKLAYMPFPDGASERRTSLFALLASGVVVITTKSKLTPLGFENSLVFSNSAEEAVTKVKMLFENNEQRTKYSIAAKTLAETYSWKNISDSHKRLYQSLAR